MLILAREIQWYLFLEAYLPTCTVEDITCGSEDLSSMDNENLSVHLDRLKERFLLAASKGGRVDELASLIDLGADVDFISGEDANEEETGEGEDGDTPLLAAIRAGHFEVASLLLASGADPNRLTADGDTALHIAAARGHADLYSLLLQHGVDVEAENAQGLTALQVAGNNGHMLQIEQALSGEAELSTDEGGGESYLSSPSASSDEQSKSNRASITGSDDDCSSNEDTTRSKSGRSSTYADDQQVCEGSSSSCNGDSEDGDTSLHEEIATLREVNAEVAEALAEAYSSMQDIEKARDDLKHEMNTYFDDETDLSALSLDELDSMETKLRSALDRVVEQKESKLKSRLEQQACVVCIEAPKTVLLLPCRHLCVCGECSQRTELTRCPLCRVVIESKIDTYS